MQFFHAFAEKEELVTSKFIIHLGLIHKERNSEVT